MFKITLFDAIENKFPKSLYNDDTFVFDTKEMYSLRELFDVIVSHYCLNLPLGLTYPIRRARDTKELIKFKSTEYNYLVLNLEINSKQNLINTLDFFKNYNCVLGEARSHDGFTNFNIKGFLEVESCNQDELKIIAVSLQEALGYYCTVLTNIHSPNSFTNPIQKHKILLESCGKAYKKDLRSLKDFIKKYEGPELELEGNNDQELCIDFLKKYNFKIIKSNNKRHILELNDEIYFWYPNNPYNIYHSKNTLKSFSIYNLVIKKSQKSRINIQEIFGEQLQGKFNENVIPNGKLRGAGKFFSSKNCALVLKSAMGTGKTNIINEVLDKLQRRRILIVTNRVSIAEESATKYNMKIYNRDKYKKGDSIIVQYDSLWKYDIDEFESVVMDEFISLIIHAKTNITQNPKNMENFLKCFEKRIFISDAFITGYENNILNKKDIVTVVNDYKDNIKLNSVEQEDTFIDLILEKAKESKNNNLSMTIGSTSLRFIQIITDILRDNGYIVRNYTATEDEISKENIVNELKNIKPSWDVLVFSPALSVGINILNQTDYYFHYDSSMSTDVIGSLQMLKRVRTANTIFYYVKPFYKKLPVKYEDIRREMLAGKITTNNSYLFSVNKYGETNLSKLGQYSAQIDLFMNLININHKASFEYLLDYQFNEKPNKIESKSLSDYSKYKIKEKDLND